MVLYEIDVVFEKLPLNASMSRATSKEEISSVSFEANDTGGGSGSASNAYLDVKAVTISPSSVSFPTQNTLGLSSIVTLDT